MAWIVNLRTAARRAIAPGPAPAARRRSRPRGQSDRLLRFAFNEFGHLWHGYSRVQAIRDWVVERVKFRSNSSDVNTSAIDTLVEGTGVCRDFAHLMIALCRALNIPARFATGIDYGADPALGPTDFHAYVEVFLGDRWYIFDASGVAIPKAAAASKSLFIAILFRSRQVICRIGSTSSPRR